MIPPLITTRAGHMVLVKEGPFLFGKDKQSMVLPAFYVDKTEVTYAAYARFCAEKGRPMPPGAAGEREDAEREDAVGAIRPG